MLLQQREREREREISANESLIGCVLSLPICDSLIGCVWNSIPPPPCPPAPSPPPQKKSRFLLDYECCLGYRLPYYSDSEFSRRTRMILYLTWERLSQQPVRLLCYLSCFDFAFIASSFKKGSIKTKANECLVRTVQSMLRLQSITVTKPFKMFK